ncbi:hypothetical protein F442_11142 [Phytophthora nicotianae P10297]|uniref:Uncharacterized protein n=1 Tax=Phytophthora nicotianae P10297 TaxID=1317064 RepID=W2Z3M1_PHYNI|nr:hypothetical protein F442_11142 [Phytophthora nicotianae P10297]
MSAKKKTERERLAAEEIRGDEARNAASRGKKKKKTNPHVAVPEDEGADDERASSSAPSPTEATPRRGDQEFPPSNASPESNIALSSSRQAAWCVPPSKKSLDMESTERAAAVATAGSAAIGTQSPPTPGDNGALNSEVEGNGVSGA